MGGEGEKWPESNYLSAASTGVQTPLSLRKVLNVFEKIVQTAASKSKPRSNPPQSPNSPRKHLNFLKTENHQDYNGVFPVEKIHKTYDMYKT